MSAARRGVRRNALSPTPVPKETTCRARFWFRFRCRAYYAISGAARHSKEQGGSTYSLDTLTSASEASHCEVEIDLRVAGLVLLSCMRSVGSYSRVVMGLYE